MKILLAISLILILAQPALSQPRIYAPDGTYLGVLSSNPFDPDSTSNQFGIHGSPYAANSINNQMGLYGSPYSIQSPNNPYAVSPPQIPTIQIPRIGQ